MSIHSMIEAVVKPVVPEIARGEYTGEADVFCVWEATVTGAAHGDNSCSVAAYAVLLNLVTPFEGDPQPTIDRLCAAICTEDLFSTPTVEHVESDEQNGYREYLIEFTALIRG